MATTLFWREFSARLCHCGDGSTAFLPEAEEPPQEPLGSTPAGNSTEQPTTTAGPWWSFSTFTQRSSRRLCAVQAQLLIILAQVKATTLDRPDHALMALGTDRHLAVEIARVPCPGAPGACGSCIARWGQSPPSHRYGQGDAPIPPHHSVLDCRPVAHPEHVLEDGDARGQRRRDRVATTMYCRARSRPTDYSAIFNRISPS